MEENYELNNSFKTMKNFACFLQKMGRMVILVQLSMTIEEYVSRRSLLY